MLEQGKESIPDVLLRVVIARKRKRRAASC
jgi:hypothetical protein